MAGSRHIVLTSHRPHGGRPPRPIVWGAATPEVRAPVIGTVTDPSAKNTIGTHAGSYSVYLAVSVAAGRLSPDHRPDLTDTSPISAIGPHPQWCEPSRIVSLDPWGHLVTEVFADELAKGLDIRPTIAVTQARLTLPELREALAAGRLKPDNRVLGPNGDTAVTKIAIDPVWHLPGIAARFGVDEASFRRVLFEYTGGMYPELVTRSDLEVFLPPIG
ncbi:MAG: hypothetical protein KDK91_12255, partial [Gammaproteobacteria bacterium]|nr:hypothetical protein [Gammaproteobacteria bacterium]